MKKIILLILLNFISICNLMSLTYTLTGAAGVTSITPKFTFSAGTVKVYIDTVYEKDLTSGVEDNIALSVGEVVDYVMSDPDYVTQIDINGDMVSGDISGWTLPSTLEKLNLNSTSVSGDISGWTLPSTLQYLNLSSTSVSGDISGWTLPSTLLYLYLYSTSVDYDSSGGAFEGVTSYLAKIDLDNCALTATQGDNVLADLVTSGVSGKALDITGTDSAPTAAGWANRATLVADGWTIVSNNVVVGVNSGLVTERPTADPVSINFVLDNSSRGLKFTTTDAITITEIGYWCDTASNEANYEVGIYDHNAGSDKPGNRIYVSDTNAKGTTAGWKYKTVDFALNASTTYWLAMQLDDTTTTNGNSNTATNACRRSYKVGDTTLGSTWSATSTEGEGLAYAIYAVYTAEEAPAPARIHSQILILE